MATVATPDKTVVLDLDQIKRILPHRYPMLLVDRVIEFNEEKRNLTAELDIIPLHCAGHFPDKAIMPGFHITEALAQAGGLLLALLYPNEVENGVSPMLRSMRGAKWKHMALPGDCLRLEVRFTNSRHPAYKLQGKAFVDDIEVVSISEITLFVTIGE